jgi:catechol 2,3-dioxygenase-like lactoylglutathione lyase family enzyme
MGGFRTFVDVTYGRFSRRRAALRQRIGLTTLVVRNYDEALSYYTQKLGFVVIEDTIIDDTKRWIVVAPRGATESGLLLARAANKGQKKAVGLQAGGRVFLFLHTDDFQRDFIAYKNRGVAFLEDPRQEPYGIVAMFADLYGNRWDLIEPNGSLVMRTLGDTEVARDKRTAAEGGKAEIQLVAAQKR